MKKTLLCILAFILSLTLFSCNYIEENNISDKTSENLISEQTTEYDPEMLVRNACFDEYYSFSDEEGLFRNKLFGGIIASLTKRSFVYTSRGVGKFLWTEKWLVNEEIPYFNDILMTYAFDRKKEDLVCLTISEHIDYQDYNDSSYSCLFSVNKLTREVMPLTYYSTENGVLEDEISIDSDMSINASYTINAFYILIKYSMSDAEYLKEYVYGQYN